MSEVRYWEKSITTVPHSCGDSRCSVTEKITKSVGIFFKEDYQHNTIAYASVMSMEQMFKVRFTRSQIFSQVMV